MEAEEEVDSSESMERDDAMNRVVVKLFWMQLGKPTDPEEWKHRSGVIATIRHRIGKGAKIQRRYELTRRHVCTQIALLFVRHVETLPSLACS